MNMICVRSSRHNHLEMLLMKIFLKRLIKKMQTVVTYTIYFQLPCVLLKTLPCVAVFMSSLTIMVIAADRYRIIVHSSSKQVTFQ